MMGDVPGDEKKVDMWNGGKTNEYNEMIRESEDYYDTIDSEIEFREELVKRQEIMDKTRIKRKPLHELYQDIDYEKKTKISGMGGVGGPIDVVRSAGMKKGKKQ